MEADAAFEARQVGSEAEVRAGAKGQRAGVVARDIEEVRLGKGVRVAQRAPDEQVQRIPSPDLDVPDRHVLTGEARVVELAEVLVA